MKQQDLLFITREEHDTLPFTYNGAGTLKSGIVQRLFMLCLNGLLLLAGFGSQSSAQTLMPIPVHSTIYSGLVRGYWFTAPCNFTITGLKVCPEAGSGLQYIHVFKINDPTPVVYPTTSSNFTTLQYIQGATNNVVQTVSISVTTGDKIGILGAVGSTTDNSYSGSVTPYSTTINGLSVTLVRMGYQGGITTASAPNYFTELTGPISRVEMWYTVTSPCTGSPNTPTIITAAITTPICENGTKAIAAVDPSPPTGIQYQWEQSASSSGPWANATGGTGATTLSYTTAALTTTTWFRVKATCGINTAASAAYQVLVLNPPAQPGTITGSTVPCNAVSQTYSVSPVTNATSYTWTLPTGWSGTSSTNSITGTPGLSGTISVTASNACGTSTAQTLAVSVNSIPSQPGAITGPSGPCPNATIAYSITPISGATSYTWSLPVGYSGSSSTSTISVTTGTGSGNISVSAVNACGSSASTSLFITPISQPPAPLGITGSIAVCSGTSQTYTVPAVSGLTYAWTAPAGWAGTSSTNSITYTAGTASGNISVSAVAACGTSLPTTLAVTATTTLTPAVSITTPVTTMCASTVSTFTATATNGGSTPVYQWKKNGFNVGANSSTYTDPALNNGDVISVVLTTSAPCFTASTASSNGIAVTIFPNVVPGININTQPGTSTCAGTPVTFLSNITGGGTTPLYQWFKNGAVIPGATTPTYTSSALTNNDSISAVLTSNANCLLAPNMTSNKVGVVRNANVVPSVTVSASQTMPIVLGTQVTFTASYSGGGSAPELQWMKNGVVVPYATGTTYTTSMLVNGDIISVRMISSDLCAAPANILSSPFPIQVQFPAGVSNAGSWTGSLSLYPNPSTGRLTISADWGAGHVGERVRIDLLNTLGQSVYSTELVPDRAQWSHNVWLGDAIVNGVYQLRISAAGTRAIRQLMIQR